MILNFPDMNFGLYSEEWYNKNIMIIGVRLTLDLKQRFVLNNQDFLLFLFKINNDSIKYFFKKLTWKNKY